MRLRGVAALGVLLATLGVGACNAILGNDEGHLVADAGDDGSPVADAPAGDTTTLADGSSGDARESDAADAADANADAGDAQDASDATPPGDAGDGGPVTIARAQGAVVSLASNGFYVFWTRSPAADLRRALVTAVATSEQDVTWTSIVGNPQGVAGVSFVTMAAPSLFWVDVNAAMVRSSNFNGTIGSLGLAASSTSPLGTNGSRIAYRNGDVASSALLDGGDLATYDVPDAGPSSAFIATATDVYWVHGATSRVYRAQLPHGAPQLVFDDFNPGEPMALAADGAFLYIARRVTGDIVRCPLAGCSPVQVFETVIDNQAQPVSLSIYGSVLYWTTLGTGPGTGTANECSPQGLQCAATKVSIAQALDGPTGILCDGFGVYWGTSGIVTSGWVQRADP